MWQTVLYLNRFLSAMERKDLAQVLKECLKNARRGQWDAFVEMAQPIVASAVIRTLSRFSKPDRDLVDDLVQDTFVKLCADDFRVLRSFRAEDTLSLCAYLRMVASSTTLDHLRSQGAKKKGGGQLQTAVEDLESVLVAPGNPLKTIEQKLLIERVEGCLERQSDRDRRIFWLYHRHGYTPQNIAALPGIAVEPRGVETVLYRLTRAVRDCFRKAGLLPAPAVREGDLA